MRADRGWKNMEEGNDNMAVVCTIRRNVELDSL